MPAIYSSYSAEEPNESRKLTTVPHQIMKERFLELFMHTAHIGRTCAILGLVPRTVYHWKHNDKQFDADLTMARQVAAGVLEDEATRRAVYGVEKPVFQNGKQVGTVREYSDNLLTTLLKANAPEKFRERFSGELTGANGQPLNGETKIIHVHSNVPLASSEDEIRVDDRVTITIPEHVNTRPNDEILDNI